MSCVMNRSRRRGSGRRDSGRSRRHRPAYPPSPTKHSYSSPPGTPTDSLPRLRQPIVSVTPERLVVACTGGGSGGSDGGGGAVSQEEMEIAKAEVSHHIQADLL